MVVAGRRTVRETTCAHTSQVIDFRNNAANVSVDGVFHDYRSLTSLPDSHAYCDVLLSYALNRPGQPSNGRKYNVAHGPDGYEKTISLISSKGRIRMCCDHLPFIFGVCRTIQQNLETAASTII